MAQHIETAWREAKERFAKYDKFVEQSDSASPEGDLDYAMELYSAWILLAYAAHESALTGFGAAALATIAEVAKTPDDLPDAIRGVHLSRTLSHANELIGRTAPRRKGTVGPDELLRDAFTDKWADHSILMRFDKNAWPANVREWLERVGVDADNLRWMREPFGSGTETLESRVNALVEERNDLAHGVRPVAIQSADTMREWAGAVLEFCRRTMGVLQVTLAEGLPGLSLAPIGEVDPNGPVLGPNTAALARLNARIAVGDHLLCRGADGRFAYARVQSMQSEGTTLTECAAGQERIAITVNREIRERELILAL